MAICRRWGINTIFFMLPMMVFQALSKLFQTTRMDPISMMIVSMTLSQKPVKLRMCGKG